MVCGDRKKQDESATIINYKSQKKRVLELDVVHLNQILREF